MLLQTPAGDTDMVDEYSVAESIKKKLAQTKTEKEVHMFNELHRKLQTAVGNKTGHIESY
jgi:hypothetical protein